MFVALHDTVVLVDVEPDGCPFVLESSNRFKEILEMSKKCLVLTIKMEEQLKSHYIFHYLICLCLGMKCYMLYIFAYHHLCNFQSFLMCSFYFAFACHIGHILSRSYLQSSYRNPSIRLTTFFVLHAK